MGKPNNTNNNQEDEEQKTVEKQEESTDKVEKKEDSKKASAKTEEKKETKAAKPQTMEELMGLVDYNPVVPQVGKKVKGRIVLKTDKMLKLDINAKTAGVVSGNEFDFAADYIDELKEGDELEATVISVENQRNQVILSLKGAANDAKWEYFEDALEENKTLEAKGIEVNKGGLIVVINGVRGFVPSSQFSRKFVGDINELKGKKLEVKAIEVDRERNRLIFSERHVSEAKQLAQREQAVDAVEPGNIYQGVISGVKSFGLFMTVEVPIGGDDLTKLVEEVGLEDTVSESEVDEEKIGYVEGLIHISEISWEKVDHPRHYHEVGDRVLVKVLGVDEKSGKLNLSIKRLKEDPWQQVAKEYPIGTTFTGKVSRTAPFGVFVDVMPGVDGLIHTSKLDPSAQLGEGDEVTVHVDSIDPDKRRMSLSMVVTEVPMGYK